LYIDYYGIWDNNEEKKDNIKHFLVDWIHDSDMLRVNNLFLK